MLFRLRRTRCLFRREHLLDKLARIFKRDPDLSKIWLASPASSCSRPSSRCALFQDSDDRGIAPPVQLTRCLLCPAVSSQAGRHLLAAPPPGATFRSAPARRLAAPLTGSALCLRPPPTRS